MRPTAAITRFVRTESGSAGVLLLAAVAALIAANTPIAGAVDDFWHTKLTLPLGPLSITEDIQHWINDLLMAVFFFVVGLEIRRELTVGELSSWRRAITPGMAAIGGMVLPALIYAGLNGGTEAASGWGIPMATDIAFAVGVLALVGNRVPASLRAFLLSLAIVDDIGAISVIAIFYTAELAVPWLAAAGGASVLAVSVRRLVRQGWVYVLFGLFLWLAVFESGVHATIAGILLAFLLPSSLDLEKLEHSLHKWSAYLILPLFALANAGVSLSGGALGNAVSSRVTWGVVLGLLAGKLIGIPLFAYAARWTRLGELPPGVGPRHLVGVAGLAGIGFTVSLFITGLAFEEQALTDAAKVGIVAASVLAAAIGLVVLRTGRPRPDLSP